VFVLLVSQHPSGRPAATKHFLDLRRKVFCRDLCAFTLRSPKGAHGAHLVLRTSLNRFQPRQLAAVSKLVALHQLSSQKVIALFETAR
jgi:hypothetical protein